MVYGQRSHAESDQVIMVIDIDDRPPRTPPSHQVTPPDGGSVGKKHQVQVQLWL